MIPRTPTLTRAQYIIMNLGMSPSFQEPEADLPIPGKMRVDWIRVYQDPDNLSVGCDPKDRPTMDYISRHIEAYTNPNHTLWSDIGQSFPGNSFAGDWYVIYHNDEGVPAEKYLSS